MEWHINDNNIQRFNARTIFQNRISQVNWTAANSRMFCFFFVYSTNERCVAVAVAPAFKWTMVCVCESMHSHNVTWNNFEMLFFTLSFVSSCNCFPKNCRHQIARNKKHRLKHWDNGNNMENKIEIMDRSSQKK